MKRMPTVSVVIPALNEEKNLPSLLTKLVSQQVKNFISVDITLVSDGSTDRTVAIAKDFGPKVRVSAYRSRRGKAYRLNQVFRKLKSDYLVVVDADQNLDGDHMLESLVRQFTNDSRVGLVCGHVKAISSGNLVSKIANFGYRVWDRARDALGKNGIRYRVDGGLIAYSGIFAKTLQFPLGQGYLDDDSYSYFAAKKAGFGVAFAAHAVTYQKLPSNLSDYLSQMVRYLNAPALLEQYFPDSLIQEFETMSRQVKLKALATELVQSPLLGSTYLLTQLFTKIYAKLVTPTYFWQTAGTTK